jgi:hypothetical protein
VAGETNSSDFPTVNSYQTFGGVDDAFVTRLSMLGNSLTYSTFLGGSDSDYATGLAVDASGNAYVTGETVSTDFPTQNAYQTAQSGQDIFVTKLSPAVNLVFSTYLGGDDDDYVRGIAVDAGGHAYLTGCTHSADFPTLDAFQSGPGSLQDSYVTKFAADGASLVYSTYLGGEGVECGSGIVVDENDHALVTGLTGSPDFPTQSPYQAYLGYGDVFVTEFSADGAGLLYSTYLGGGGEDWSYAIAEDGNGNAYVTGNTRSSDFPTRNPYQTYQGGGDIFVTKLVSPYCCAERVGDANGEGGDEPTIGDVSTLINALFIAGHCEGILECLTEADINLSGGALPECNDITIGDVSDLIDYLFVSGPSIVVLPDCP